MYQVYVWELDHFPLELFGHNIYNVKYLVSFYQHNPILEFK